LQEHKIVSTREGSFVSRQYDYDESDNIAVLEEGGRGKTEFRYDSLGRLTEVRRAGQLDEFYRYDPVGTILDSHRGRRVVSKGGRTLYDGQRDFEYDSAGCVAAIKKGAAKVELQYDAFGKIVRAKLPDGHEVRYCYDALGRRTSKEVGGKRTDFIWHSCDLAAEITDDKPAQTYYFYHQKLFGQWEGSQRFFPFSDHTCAVQHLLDSRGTMLWQASLEAYGKVASQEGALESPFRFRGQYFDRETGLHYNFYRYYDPQLGDYVAPDPLRLIGGANFYAYPRNPLLWDDPFGLSCGKPKCKGDEAEAAMDAHYADDGFERIDEPGRARGIDRVYVQTDPSKIPPTYIIAESKYGTAGLGSCKCPTNPTEQMSDHWIDTPIGRGDPARQNRLEQAVGPAVAADIQAKAASNPANVQKEVCQYQPGPPGTTGQGTVNPQGQRPYTPNSGNPVY
jgi:RHS repeat-associated protein